MIDCPHCNEDSLALEGTFQEIGDTILMDAVCHNCGSEIHVEFAPKYADVVVERNEHEDNS